MFGPLDYEIQPLDSNKFILDFFPNGFNEVRICIAKMGILMLKIYVETSHECVSTFC